MVIDVAISPRGTAHAMELCHLTRDPDLAYWRALCGRYRCRYEGLVPASGPALPSLPCGACLRRRRTQREMERKELGPYGLWEEKEDA